MTDLSINAIRSMLWNLTETFGLRAIQLVVSVILARLLLPEQFGLIGMLTLFMALAQSLLESGFGSALIQKKEANQLDACSVFYLNLLVAIVLALVLYGAAPLIAGFYQAPPLLPLTRFLCLNILFSVFVLVPSTLLAKRMDFKRLVTVSVISVVISGAVGVGLAIMGKGVWSLAVQMVLNTLIRAVLLWKVSHWRPSLIFSRASLSSMFSFGSRMMMSGLLHTFFENIYQPLIGKMYSAADVGFYVRAQTLQDAAMQPAGFALGRVMFPALSPMQDDPVRLKQAARKTITTAVFFHFPLMIGLLVVADSLITVLLTERWAPSIPYFRLFCAVGLLLPLDVINLTVLQVNGRSDLFFRLEVIKKLLVVLAIAITYRSGITALLYGQVAVAVLAYVVNSYFSGTLVGYPMARQIRDVYIFLLMSLAMGGCMYLVGNTISPAVPRLLAQVVLGVAVYLGLNRLTGSPVLSEIVGLTKQAIQSPLQPSDG